MARDNMDQLTVLSAAAAATSRVRLMSNVTLLAAHTPIVAAKRFASIDVISGGRLVVGVGVGGRPSDYLAAGAEFSGRFQRLDEHVALMRRTWSGTPLWEGTTNTVLPRPLQPGGPPIFCSAQGTRSRPRAARWADGITASLLSAELSLMRTEVRRYVQSWSAAGRTKPPYMVNTIFVALGNDAEQRLSEYVSSYLQATKGRISSPVGQFTSLSTFGIDGVRRAIDACEEAGFDELIFQPVTQGVTELDVLMDVLATR